MSPRRVTRLQVALNGVTSGKLVRLGTSGGGGTGGGGTTPTTPVTQTPGTHTLLVSPTTQPESFRRLVEPWWSTPLAATAPASAASDRYVTALLAQLQGTPTSTPFTATYPRPYNTIVQASSYSAPTYTMPEGTALQKVYVVDNKTSFRSGVTSDLKTVFDRGVPVPDPSLLNGNTIAANGSDGHAMFFQPYTAADGVKTARMWEVWRFAAGTTADVAAGYNWRCQQGGYIEDIRYHRGWWQGSDQSTSGGNWGVSASGASYANATLTGRDWARFNAGQPLDHPLILQVIFTGGQPEDVASAAGGAFAGGNFYLPATRYDKLNLSGKSNDEKYRLPEGTRFRLDPAVWTDSAIATYAAANGIATKGDGAPTAQLAWFMRGFRDYGFMAAESAGTMALVAEHPQTFGTIYNPYTDVPQWGNVLQQYPSTGVIAVKSPPTRLDEAAAGPTAPNEELYDYSLAAVPASAKFNLLSAAATAPSSTAAYTVNGSGATLTLNTSWQPEGLNAIQVTYGTASGDSGLVAPAVAGMSPGDRVGVHVLLRRHQGSKRVSVNVRWRNSAGTVLREVGGPYMTKLLETDQIEEFTLTAPQSLAVATVEVTIHSSGDTPTAGDSFSIGALQVWKISSAA